MNALLLRSVRRGAWVPPLALLVACPIRFAHREVDTAVNDAWCDVLALTTPDGDIDECDLEACRECARHCRGDTCEVRNAYPPQYVCDDYGREWTVYDVCEDWQMSGFQGCDDASSSIASDQVTTLGFSSDEVLAALLGPYDLDAEYVAEEGRSDTVVHLAITANGAPSFHDRTPIADGTGQTPSAGCPDYLDVPVTVTLRTDDGAFDETLHTSIEAMDLAALSVAGELNWRALDGSFQFVTVDPTEWQEVTLGLQTALTASADGQVALSRSRYDGIGTGEAVVGALLRWPPQ